MVTTPENDFQQDLKAIRADIAALTETVGALATQASKVEAAIAKDIKKATKSVAGAGEDLWDEGVQLGHDAARAASDGGRAGVATLEKQIRENPVNAVLIALGRRSLASRGKTTADRNFPPMKGPLPPQQIAHVRHVPPTAAGGPNAAVVQSACARPRRSVTPAARSESMIGRTFAAKASASFSTAPVGPRQPPLLALRRLPSLAPWPSAPPAPPLSAPRSAAAPSPPMQRRGAA